MKGLLLFVAGAVIGAIVTFGIAAGLGAGAGIATGMQAGACLAVDTAKEKGFVTPEQVNEILADAGKQIVSGEYTADTPVSPDDLQCEKVVADLKAAAAQAK